jgi:DNA-binding CsgD family transcriptional regulator
MATQQSLAKRGIRAGGNGECRGEGSCIAPPLLGPARSICETVGASSRATSLAAMGPERFAVSAVVLNIVESLGCGGFLIDRERQLLALNPTGVDCLAEGLTMRRNRVAATDRESDVRLQSLIGVTLNSTDSAYSSASMLVRRHARLPLAVHVVRLRDEARPALNGAGLLLVAFDPERCQPPPPDMLTEVFRLTPAEANVAIGIADGRHLAEIAADRGVKIGTVRAYSKTVFAKTGTRGQAELATLLTRLAYPTMAPEQNRDRT